MTRARRRALAAFAAGCALLACGGAKKGAAVGPQAPAAMAPANPQAVTKMAQGVHASKDPSLRSRAVSLLREAVALDPALWEARFDLGVILAGAGDLAGAEEELKAAAKIAKDAPEVAVALGEVRRRRGEHKAAADGLEDFVREHPSAVDARIMYVASLRDSGQVEKAIKEAREVLVRKPGDASALAELALCHLSRGEKDSAALLARQALDGDPHSAIAERATGLIMLANGDDAQAFAAFTKATHEDPRDTTARLNMGAVLLRAGVYAKAAEQFRAILQVSPDDTSAQVGLAAALRGEAERKGTAKLEEARRLLEGVLERDPHHVGALYNLGVLYADFLKGPAEAKGYFARFLSDAPSDHPSRAEAERYLAAVSTAAKSEKLDRPDKAEKSDPKKAEPKKGGGS
jgi:tetratricopeptide (TPR) repeat protein